MTVTIVCASKVGVKVGMVGRDVGGTGVEVGSFRDSRGVEDGKGELVIESKDGRADESSITESIVGVG